MKSQSILESINVILGEANGTLPGETKTKSLKDKAFAADLETGAQKLQSVMYPVTQIGSAGKAKEIVLIFRPSDDKKAANITGEFTAMKGRVASVYNTAGSLVFVPMIIINPKTQTQKRGLPITVNFTDILGWLDLTRLVGTRLNKIR